MSYLLNGREQRILEDAIAYGKRHFEPYAAQWESEGRFPSETYTRLGADGYLGMYIDKTLGGQSMSFLESALIYEGLSRSSFSMTLAIECHNNMSYEMSIFDTSDEVKGLLPGMVGGDELLAFGLTEPQAGSDPNSMSSYATPVEGGYLLNGLKTWVTNGCEATQFDVTVKLGGADERQMVTFLIDMFTEGLEIVSDTKTMGGNLLSKAVIRMTDCFVPASRLVSRNGYKDAIFSVLIARIFTPAMAIGLCEEAIESTAEYLGERIQFGRPLLSNQTIQWELGELQAKVEAGRQLVYHTAAMMDTGVMPKREAAMSKLFCGDLAMEVTTACCQLMGAEGYRTGSKIERLFREAKMASIIDGTSEIQKLLLGADLVKRYVGREY